MHGGTAASAAAKPSAKIPTPALLKRGLPPRSIRIRLGRSLLMPDFFTSIFRAAAPSHWNGTKQQHEERGGQDHLIMLVGTDSAIQMQSNAVFRTKAPGATPQGWWGFTSRAFVSPDTT